MPTQRAKIGHYWFSIVDYYSTNKIYCHSEIHYIRKFINLFVHFIHECFLQFIDLFVYFNDLLVYFIELFVYFINLYCNKLFKIF